MENEKNNDIHLKGNDEFFIEIQYFKNIQNEINNFGDNSYKKIKNITLKNYVFRKLSLKYCEFEDCTIKYSRICEYSYLRHASFKKVDFTGTLFENVNLEKAKFENCKLCYVKFENCIIDYKEILKSKPNEPNLAIILLKSLYKNELQQGNNKNADEILLLLKDEEINLYSKFLKCVNKTSKNDDPTQEDKSLKYYKKEIERMSLTKEKIILELINLKLSKCIWGYGIKIGNIVDTMIFSIFVFSLLYLFFIPNQNLCDCIFLSIRCWILNNEYSGSNFINLLMITENFFGIISIALFTSALYRKVEK